MPVNVTVRDPTVEPSFGLVSENWSAGATAGSVMSTVVSPAPLPPRTSVTRTACCRAAVDGKVTVADHV